MLLACAKQASWLSALMLGVPVALPCPGFRVQAKLELDLSSVRTFYKMRSSSLGEQGRSAARCTDCIQEANEMLSDHFGGRDFSPLVTLLLLLRCADDREKEESMEEALSILGTVVQVLARPVDSDRWVAGSGLGVRGGG